jgi:hypothetical protein
MGLLLEGYSMSTYTFDGCGINCNGRRILTGARADWDTPEFKAFCKLAEQAPALLAALIQCRDLLDQSDVRHFIGTEQGNAAPLHAALNTARTLIRRVMP